MYSAYNVYFPVRRTEHMKHNNKPKHNKRCNATCISIVIERAIHLTGLLTSLSPEFLLHSAVLRTARLFRPGLHYCIG